MIQQCPLPFFFKLTSLPIYLLLCVSLWCSQTARCLCLTFTPTYTFINCSFFSVCRLRAAVGWGCEPVWHQVYQTDAGGQSRWHFAQPQRRARLRCEIILLIRLLFCPLHNEASDSQRLFTRLLFLGFHIRGSIGPRESKGRLLIRTPSEKCTPTQQQPTHAHQVTQRKTLLGVCI